MERATTGLAEGGARAQERKIGPGSIYSVELEVFEGPLDLLLHLVRKHELDILDIPIAFVAEKYLEYLDVMRALDLEVAGDYLVMAATLAYLKSRELLPPEPRSGEEGESGEEDGEDPREALIRRLLEYERFKQAAVELDALPVSGRDVFARGSELDVPPIDPGLAPVSLFSLAEAYYRVLTRAKVESTHDVTIEAVTVSQRIHQLALILDEKPAFDFDDLFLGRTWSSERELRMMLVVTLMSILEMVKLGVAGVQQPPESAAIRIYRRATAEQTSELLVDYDEDRSFGAAGEPPARGGEPTSALDLDASEEAALLAEALAAAQEPVDPVQGYDGDADEPAANEVAAAHEPPRAAQAPGAADPPGAAEEEAVEGLEASGPAESVFEVLLDMSEVPGEFAAPSTEPEEPALIEPAADAAPGEVGIPAASTGLNTGGETPRAGARSLSGPSAASAADDEPPVSLPDGADDPEPTEAPAIEPESPDAQSLAEISPENLLDMSEAPTPEDEAEPVPADSETDEGGLFVRTERGLGERGIAADDEPGEAT